MAERSRDRPFAAALLVWVLASVGFWLAYYPLMERLTPGALAILGVGVLVGAPLILLAWAVWRAARRQGGWIAAPAVVMAAVSMIGSGLILERVSAYLNFQAQKADYDAAVARAGASAAKGPILFLWQERPNLLVGVVHDPAGCEPAVPRPGLRRKLEGDYCFVSEPRP